MSTFYDLNHIVRNTIQQSEHTNPEQLAKEIAARIPKKDRDAALTEALLAVVRVAITNIRNTTEIRTETPRPNRSAKVIGIREWWRQALTEIYAVNTLGDKKRLADCTRDDLTSMIRIREDAARRTLAKAEQLRGLHQLLEQHDAATVGDLPQAVLATTLVRAA